MLRISHMETPRAAEDPQVPGLETRWLLDGSAAKTTMGMLGHLRLAAGDEIPLRSAAEHELAVLVLSGSGTVLTSNGDSAATEGTLCFAPPGAWLGLRAGADALELMLVVGHTNRPEDLRWDYSAPQPGSPPVILDHADRIEREDYHDPAAAIHHFGVQWLVSEPLRGSHTISLGRTTFRANDGAHELHGHPGGAEFLYLLKGRGVHVGPEGALTPFGAGEVTYAHAGELHGFRNTESTDTVAIFGWLGACSMEAAGYAMPGE